MTTKTKENTMETLLWLAAGLLLLGMLFARAVFPELIWLSLAIGVPLVAVLGELIRRNMKALRSRTAAHGLHSGITIVLVLGIVGVLNFISYRYPFKADLTKNKVHTLSDQTEKLVRGLTKPVKATLFSKLNQREEFRPLLENYKAFSTKFEVEFVDPDREPTRAKQLGVKKYGTLHLAVGNRDTKVEELNEEKLTNALIKLLKDKSPTLCAITGHGEKSFTGQEAEGYQSARQALVNQAYEIKDLNLVQEGKVPETCDAIAILGPTKSYFQPEVKLIQDYLNQGGRALIALDVNIKGGEYAPELLPVLASWNVKPVWTVIVDPLSKMLGVDASVPIVASYSKEHAITKSFDMNSFFPIARPLEVLPGAPGGLTAQWIAQTTPKSWGVADAQQLAKGEVKFTAGKDRAGPMNVAIAVEGKQKDSKAARNTRLVVFGSSHFATNNYSRFGGNMDFFLNSASWLMEDESLISIRAKEQGPGKVELSQKAGTSIFLVTVLIVPLLIATCGIVIWVRRRKL